MDARLSLARRTGAPRPLFLLLGLLIAGLAACSTPAATPSPSPAAPSASAAASATPAPTASPTLAAEFPVTLTDDQGTQVTLAAEPRRIVTLTPASTETVFALGLGGRLVGKVQDFSLYPAAAADVPDVAKIGVVDVEQIVARGADLVIAGGDNFNPPEAIERLRSLGIPTLVIFAPDLSTTIADIALVGRATGRPAEAATVTASIRAAFDEVAAATASLPKPRVFYELDASQGFFGPAPDYFGTAMIRVAGGEPLTSGTDGVYQIEAERILAFDPQVVLLGDAAYGVTPDQVAARPGWASVSAVISGNVRPIDDVIVTRPGPRLADGIRALAIAIHPELVLGGASPAPSASAGG